MASVLATIIPSKNPGVESVPGPVVVYPDSEITVGRAPKCTVSFPDIKYISHVHCIIRNKDGVIQMKSVSSNKTLLDSKPVQKDEWLRLKDGSSITLSLDPKIKLEVRIGSQAITSPGKKRKVSKKRAFAIAEITSYLLPELEYLVVPSSKHSRDISVTIGRAKDCDICLDNKKISSTHVKLIFSRIEGESIHWNLLVEAVSSQNKTYVGDQQVEETYIVDQLTAPLQVCLVFPQSEKPVEVLTITPLFNDESVISENESREPLTAAEMIQQEIEKEEKRQRKELRQLEKKNQVWEVEYQKEIQKLQDSEHSLTKEIEVLGNKINDKRNELIKMNSVVSEIEDKMNLKESHFKEEMNKMKSQHDNRLVDLTQQLNQTIAELQKLNDEKLKLQMNMNE